MPITDPIIDASRKRRSAASTGLITVMPGPWPGGGVDASDRAVIAWSYSRGADEPPPAGSTAPERWSKTDPAIEYWSAP